MVQTIAVITIIYASFATIIQEDTKKLIAYSSIVVILGLFSNSLKVKLSIHEGKIKVQFLFSAKIWYLNKYIHLILPNKSIDV